MDCDTTGIEPDFSLVKFKELVGGGRMTIVNRTVPLALETLGYSRAEIEQIVAYIDEHGTIIGAPGAEGRAPAGVRRRGRPARDLAHGPHQDDGRRAAVHLGRDLEDGEHAGRGHGRRHRRRVPAGVAPRRQGARDLPRRVEDGAGAAHRRAEGQEGRGGRSAGRSSRGRIAAQDAAGAPVDHAQVLDRRATRATSRPACTRTARSARSSSPTSARRARRCAA